MSSKHKSCKPKKSISDTNSNSKSGSESTFDTLPYYSEKYAAYDETAIHQTKNCTSPVIEAKPEKYTPIPYFFRVLDNTNRKCITTTARCPPFHIQLDHAIAVVWTLYSKKETDIPLGINQLQWAYSFLQNVKDKDSSYPPDISHCLDSIADELIEQYADMADCYATPDPTPKSSSSSFDPQANSTRHGGDEDTKSCTCAPKDRSNVHFADNKEDTCSRTSSVDACRKQPDRPFSVTYNDMKLHNRNLDNSKPKKKVTLCNNDYDTSVNVLLNELRKDQLKKILAELDRLQSIEKYIIESDHVEHYLDDDDSELKEYIENKLNCKNKCSAADKNEKNEEKKSKVSTASSSGQTSHQSIEEQDEEENNDDEHHDAENNAEESYEDA